MTRYLGILLLLLLPGLVLAQPKPKRYNPPPKQPVKTPPIADPVVDSDYYTMPPTDSARYFDSVAHVQWDSVRVQQKETFQEKIQPRDYSLLLGYSTLGKFQAPDLAEYFARRVGRANPEEERSIFSTTNRFVYLGLERLVSDDWAATLELDLLGRYLFTTVTESTNPEIPNGDAQLDYDATSILLGASWSPLKDYWYRFRLNAGVGPAFISVHEVEQKSGATRDASVTGVSTAFDISMDIRALRWVSFTLSLHSRMVSAGELKTSDGKSLASPFGTRTSSSPIQPDASSLSAGLLLGVVLQWP